MRWTNKSHFPVCFIIPLHKRHQDSQDRGPVAFPPKPEPADWMNWMQLPPWGSCWSLFIPLFIYVIEMTVMSWLWCHNCLPPILGGKSLCACAVESCQLACTSADIPDLPPCVLTWTAKLNLVPQFLQLWHSPPGISVHPHTRACNLLKLSIWNQYKLTRWVWVQK